jgi:glycosyltransferase involved in cell wall biosynthesis
MLAKRTQIIAGCGRDEMLIAQKFMKAENTAELINICDPISIDAKPLSEKKYPVIAMLGRVSSQKGYDYFAKVAGLLRHDAKFLWIGGGDVHGEILLKASGVEVTGWASRSVVLEQLVNADLYLHTAAWDGFPISVLEAAELGLPIILRKIGPFSSENLKTVNSPEEAAQKVLGFINGYEGALEEATQNSIDIRNYHTVNNLQLSLNELYMKFKGA